MSSPQTDVESPFLDSDSDLVSVSYLFSSSKTTSDSNQDGSNLKWSRSFDNENLVHAVLSGPALVITGLLMLPL